MSGWGSLEVRELESYSSAAKERTNAFLRQLKLFVQDIVSGAGFLKLQQCCRTLGERFISSMADVKHTIRVHVWVSRFLEMLGTNRSGIFLLSITAAQLHPQLRQCCLVFLLQVCGSSFTATQSGPRSRSLKKKCLKIHGMVWNGIEG